MPSRHVSIRMEQDAYERLEAESRRNHEPLSTLAKRLIEEGLRMERHPAIVFKDGPAGRRARLIDGEDVWEVISAFPKWNDSWDVRSDVAIGSSNLTARQIMTALKYYADYPDEIDERIRAEDDAWNEALAEGSRRQAVAIP